MLAIVALGAAANKFWPASLGSGLVTSDPSTTRIDTMIGNQNSVGLTIVILMAGAAAAILITRNWFRIQRTLNKGERFIVKHPWLDVILVTICTVGILLTRSTI